MPDTSASGGRPFGTTTIGPMHTVAPDDLGLMRAQRMDESRLVQVTPLEKQIEDGLLQRDLAAMPRETMRRAPSRSTGFLRAADAPPARRSGVCGRSESERCRVAMPERLRPGSVRNSRESSRCRSEMARSLRDTFPRCVTPTRHSPPRTCTAWSSLEKTATDWPISACARARQ